MSYTIHDLMRWRVDYETRYKLNETESGQRILKLLDDAYNGDSLALETLNEREAIMLEGLDKKLDIVTVANAAVRGYSTKRRKPERPTVLEVNFDGLPQELWHLKQWVMWRYMYNPGKEKWTKIPFTAYGDTARSNTPSTWSTLQECHDAYFKGKYDGIGFAFKAGGNLVGVDLDHSISCGRVSDYAQEVISTLKSYTEQSPSGTGVHIIIKGTFDGKGKNFGFIEFYQKGRFFTFTGQGDRRPITCNPEALKKVILRAWEIEKERDIQLHMF